MANTFTLIQSATVGAGGAASIDFTSISNTFTDLALKMSLRGTDSNVAFALQMRFNGSSALSQYYTKDIQGTGSSVNSGGQNGLSYLYTGNPPGNGSTANTFGNLEFYFSNYASSSNKSYSLDTVGENNATFSVMNLLAGSWLNSAAINQITLFNEYGNFAQHSTAYLYGIVKS